MIYFTSRSINVRIVACVLSFMISEMKRLTHRDRVAGGGGDAGGSGGSDGVVLIHAYMYLAQCAAHTFV